MSHHLPVLSGQEVVKTFQSFGWRIMRRTSSHVILAHGDSTVSLSVPDHNEVAKGTLRSLIRQADLTVAEFENAIPLTWMKFISTPGD